MLPAVAITLVHLAVLLYVFLAAATLIPIALGLTIVPVLVAILLSIWWLRSSQVAFKERLLGLALVGAAVAWIVLSHSSGGVNLLMFALPVMTFGTVGLLMVTTKLPWRARRVPLVVLMAVCAAFFTTLRVEGTGGDFLPVVSWRWTPAVELASLPTADKSSSAAVLPAVAGPDDWPAFRGPGRDNHVLDATFATNWSENPPRELWRNRIGLGWSSFTVVGDYFFTQEQRGDDELVVCYSAVTGDYVWANSVKAFFQESNGSGPRATPTFHQGKLYVQGAMGAVQCIDASTGKTLWKRELTKDAEAKVPQWGFSSSPLIVGDLAIVFAGGPGQKSVVAYHLDSGEVAWHGGDGTHGYSSGHFAQIAGVPQVLVCSDIGIQSLSPDTGEVLWQYMWTAMSNPRCVQPLVLEGNSVLIGTAGGQGTRRLDIGLNDTTWSVEERWATRRLRPYFNDYVLHKGYCYGFDGRQFNCTDVETGERVWKGERYGGQVLLLPDMDMLLILTEKGHVVLVEATPEGHREIADIKAIDGKTWNHPVIAGGKLFVRNSEEVACFKLPT